MKVRPLFERVLVVRNEQEGETSGGIIIPEAAKEKQLFGTVIAVGQGKVNEEGKVHPLDVKTGDQILFAQYAGTEIKVEGIDHLILCEEEILGIVD